MTLYFYGTVSGDEALWTDTGTGYGNWFTDHAVLGGAHTTVPASALPLATDDVVFLTTITNLGAARTVNTAVFGDSAVPLTANLEDITYALTVTGDATFNDGSTNSGTVSGNATFNDSSYNYATVTGDATFYDISYNYGLVSGDATFNDSSNNNYDATVTGDSTFNDSSNNYGTVSGDATFNDSSNNGGTVSGITYVRQSPTAFLAWRNYCGTPYCQGGLVLQFPQLDILGTGLL